MSYFSAHRTLIRTPASGEATRVRRPPGGGGSLQQQRTWSPGPTLACGETSTARPT